jgi:hypothetical protein
MHNHKIGEYYAHHKRDKHEDTKKASSGYDK